MGVPGALFDVPACVGLGIKHIISERNDPAHFGGSTITRIVSRLLMRKANGFVFQTKDAQAFYGGEIAKHSVIIPNPLFIGDDYPDTQYVGEREETIVTTGRLNKQKNHPLLIRAFKRIAVEFPEYKLIIYGEGPERQNDEALISELGLQERVLLPGTINDVPAKIYKSSLYVLSSDFEGMPNALMEAMALGLPCISTDCPCGGPRELIYKGYIGMLVPVDD
jgi:glycosyltransferase involved in cell wall biosynthesis